MTDHLEHIDEFESMFKRAEREPFLFEEIPIQSVALITDGTQAEAETLKASLVGFLPRLKTVDPWHLIVGSEYGNVGELMDDIAERQTDLIVTYRHLQEKSLVPQHSLGVYLDVITQMTRIPVLVLPGTAAEPVSLEGRTCGRLMVVTDHISGDSRLINYAVTMSDDQDEIWLVHVEDDAVFERYMSVIGRIPEIETDRARALIEAQLLKEAQDFIETCIAELNQKIPRLTFYPSVKRGHHLRQYRDLITAHDVDLLVANTKDEDQLAMHGIAYSLSVEMIDVALLLL